jgi:hypothetical protein
MGDNFSLEFKTCWLSFVNFLLGSYQTDAQVWDIREEQLRKEIVLNLNMAPKAPAIVMVIYGCNTLDHSIYA